MTVRAQICIPRFIYSTPIYIPNPCPGITPYHQPLADAIQKCFDDTRLADFPFIDGTLAMLATFKARGIKVVIITNGHHFIQV
jgi:hypothetical protein